MEATYRGRRILCLKNALDFAFLPDQLHFERIEFWIRQATEEIDAMSDLGCNLKKAMPYLLRRARETKRIRRMPMGDNRLTWPDRSRLFGLVRRVGVHYEFHRVKPLVKTQQIFHQSWAIP
jgi:hypothetical protein